MEKITLSFVAGVALAAFWPGGGLACPAPVPLAAALLALWAALRPGAGAVALPAGFFATGLFCALSHAMLPPAGGPGAIGVAAARAAQALRAHIAAIPFAHAQTSAVLTALLTGARSGLDRETVAAFRASGASHLLALSGLHLGFIYLLIRRVFGVLGNAPAARILRCVCTVLAAGFYTLMTGASASTVRAFLFILLREATALSEQRGAGGIRSLEAALVIQLALDPGQITRAGFQLSYLAMCGILLVHPRLQAWYPAAGPRFDPFRRLWQSLSLSVSCQVFTAPVAWWHFHTFPRYFLLTNLLTLPLCPAVMALGIGTVVLAAVGACPQGLIALTDRAVGLLLAVVGIVSKM